MVALTALLSCANLPSIAFDGSGIRKVPMVQVIQFVTVPEVMDTPDLHWSISFRENHLLGYLPKTNKLHQKEIHKVRLFNHLTQTIEPNYLHEILPVCLLCI